LKYFGSFPKIIYGIESHYSMAGANKIDTGTIWVVMVRE
jgi:hypothetical protein